MDYKLKTVDAETLLSTPMNKTMFVVDGLIPQGVNVISGASKIGKSWLMLWLGLQVSQGFDVVRRERGMLKLEDVVKDERAIAESDY